MSIEIASTYNPLPMTWADANEYVKTLGDGWRLPTDVELEALYADKEEFFNELFENADVTFASVSFWTSRESLDDCAWYLNAYNGAMAYGQKKFPYHMVWAVRDL